MVYALVSLYNPDQQVTINVESIANQVDRVYICDNSPQNHEMLFDALSNGEYIYNNANLALSAAFNKVLKCNNGWKDDDFVIFFDQDTTITAGHIERMIAEFNRIKARGVNISCLEPVFTDKDSGELIIPKKKKRVTENCFIVDELMTSSALVQYGDIRSIGFWNEEIFLDLADWDLGWRLNEAGGLTIQSKTIVIQHSLGVGEKKIGALKMGHGAPIREYYQARNYLYLLHKNYTPVLKKLRFIRNLIIRPVIHCVFLGDGKARLRYRREGIIDYYRNYHGEYTLRHLPKCAD